MAQLRQTGSRDLLITAVASEDDLLKFWGLPRPAIEILTTYENHFQKTSSELEKSSGYLSSNQLPLGKQCVFYSQNQRKWFRARVIDVLGPKEVLVQLMDYGSKEVVTVDNVRALDENIFRYGPLAVECILADVLPFNRREWSPDAVRFCEEQLICETVSCYATSEYRNIPVVRIAKKGEGEPFVQRLINHGLAVIKTDPPKPQYAVQPVMNQTPSQFGYKHNRLDQNTVHLVKVSYLENVQKFYIQLAVAEAELKRLMDEIRSYTSSEGVQLVNAPSPGIPCLAPFPSKQLYYRGLITSVTHGRCAVQFVDYGYIELKEFQELRAIPTKFLSLQAQAIRCTLHNINETSHAEFCRIVKAGALLDCHVVGFNGESYVVQLKEHVQVESVQQPKMFRPELTSYPRQSLDASTSYPVTVSFINDVSEFYCQLTYNKEKLDKISENLNAVHAIHDELDLSDCSLGMPVCVKFSEDNVWYRAQIVKINHEADIEVFFVDYGNFDNASLRDVRRMKSSMISLPVMAYKCRLHEVDSPTDSSIKDAMYDLFEELTTGQDLTANIMAIVDGAYSIILKEDNTSASINQKLLSEFSGIPLVPVSGVEKLYVTCFTSPTCFFTQFEKLSSQKLEDMQKEINALYSSSRNTSYKPNVGDFVCAKFVGDQHYYRAKVEAITGTNCSVFFVDYGNRETASLLDVHPLNSKFLKEPQFGIECGLETCPPATPVEKLRSLLEENSIEAKMIREQEGKWFIALTENFPGNVAILELLRQHEMLVPRSIHGAGLRGFQENVVPREERNHFQSSSNSDFSRQQFREPGNRQNSFSSPPKTETDSYQSYSCTSIPKNAFRNVVVSHVVTPSEFYCQIEEESTKLQVMMKDIEDTYSNINDNELRLKSMAVDSPCCAVFEDDGAWYRGQIKRVDRESCTVYFVDYGNTDTVPVSKIKQLERKFFTLPLQAVCCKLYNVSPDGSTWSDSAIDDFYDKTLDKSFVAQFVESDSKNVYSVNLVSIGKLQEDALNKEFASFGQGGLKNSNKVQDLNSHAAPVNLNYQPPVVKLNSLEPVSVTYGLTPGEIFVQLKANEDGFVKMMRNLQDYYSRVSNNGVDRPQQGMICVAQFHLDSAWYRGQIQKVDNNSLVVYFVDYGNSENVDRKKVQCITQDFTQLPIQGVKCRLKDIKPPGAAWSLKNDISKYFEGSSECRFISKEGDCYLIELFCNKANVAEQLVRDGIADTDSPALKPKPAAAPVTQSKWPERKSTFVSGQLLTVTVSFIQSPYKFWCQLSDEASVLDQLMADIEAQYQDSTAPLSGASVQVGSCCMAKYSEDDVWYRAKITSKVSAEELEVHFVDYGNSEVTTIDRLANINPEFLKIPPQCFECRLPGSTANDDDALTDQFQGIVDEAEEITAKVENVSGGVYILSLLYEKDEEELNVSNVIFGENVQVAGAKSEDVPKFLPFDIPLGPQEGYVCIVNSPHDFFIQLSGIEDDLAELSTELTAVCEAMAEGENAVPNATVGCACAAKFSEDENWYRAEVTNIHDAMADVLFVDYGNTSSVPVESLKLLSQKHLDMPPYAIRCKLNGIASNGESWAQASIDAFLDMVDELLLGVTFISKDVPATVNISKDDKDVAQSLIEMELAIVETCPETEEAYADDHLVAVEDQLHSLPTDLSYPKRKIKSTRLPVKISYVDAYDRFYVMPLELTTELDTVMKTLELLYGDESENGSKEGVPSCLEDPSPSLPCVAKYSEDEAWYRALITDVSKNDISVSFVDYGNSEITSLENLKPLTPELIKIPPIAIECKLYGIKATEGREQDISAKLEELYVEEIELEMEIVIKKELYEIKLFHEGDMAEALCSEGLAFEVVASHDDLIETLKETEVVVAANLENEFAEIPEEQVSGIPQQDLSSKEQVTVSVKFCEVEDGTVVLYGVPVELDEELTELQAALEASYSETERKVSQVKCNDICAAKYHEDDSWYRARVVDCNGEKIKVQFIDYGNSDEVDKDSINELLPEFMTKPQFSLKLCLTGFKVDEEKEADVQAKLDENVYEDSVVVQLCKYTHKSPNICITGMTCGDVNLLESLQSEKYLSQCYVKYFDIEDKFDGTVEHIAEDLFYVLPVKLVEMRDLLTVDLKSVCCDTSCDTSVDPAYLYAAEINGSWSRVSISEMDNSAESALVKVVDFGFETNVPLSLLKRLSIDLCHRPVALLPCRIADIDHAPLSIQNKEVEKIRGVVFHCEVQQDVTDSNILSVNLFEKTPDVSEEVSQLLEENLNIVVDSEANKPVEEDSEDLQNDLNGNAQETNSLIESSQELDQDLNDSQNSEVNDNPSSKDLESDSDPVKTESQLLLHDETIACHGFSDPGSRDIEVPIVENGYDVSNDSDVESKEVEMIEVDACEGLQQIISVLSESDASLKCATASTGETEDGKDLSELQDSEVEDNYDGANEEEESEVLISQPEGAQEAVSGDLGAVQAVEDEWDERPECDIKEESLLEEGEESQLEEREESQLEEREESLLEESQLEEREESLLEEREESQLEEREESLLEESQLEEREESLLEESQLEEREESQLEEREESQLEEREESQLEEREESLLEEREESLLEEREESLLEEREESLLEEREESLLEEREESLLEEEREESLLEEEREESESDSTLDSERKPDNADRALLSPSKPVEHLSSESNDILTSSNNVAKEDSEVDDPALSSPSKPVKDFSSESNDFLSSPNKDAKEEDSEIVDPAEQSPSKAEGDLKSETLEHPNIEDNKDKAAKESDSKSALDDVLVVNPADNKDNAAKELNSKSVLDDVLVVDPAELSFSQLENKFPYSHIDKENDRGNASKEEFEFTLEDPEVIKSADLPKPESGLETRSHPVDENLLNSSDILDSKSTAEEAEAVDSIEPSPSKPKADLDFEVEVPEEESTFSIDPALLRLSGKMDVYVRDVAISNGSIILAVTSYPCYLELEKKLHHQIQKVYSEKEPGISESSKLCAVLCNDTWYRGKIMLLSDEEVTVLLIDYGMCKTVPISAAKELTPNHKDIPPFVAWCTLTHLYCPEEKCNDTKEYLDSVLANIQDTGKIVSVEVIEEEEPYKVILFHNEDSISYNLLTENLVVQQLPEIYVASGAYKAKLSHAGEEKDKVYVNLDANFDDIKTLKISMECSYPIEGLKTSELQLNMFYAVLHNAEWMRGKAISSDEAIVLQLIDTGEVLPAKSPLKVFPLLPLHCLQPPYAILCELGSEVTKSEKLVQALRKEEFKVAIECNLDSSKRLAAKIVDKDLIERLSSQDQ